MFDILPVFIIRFDIFGKINTSLELKPDAAEGFGVKKRLKFLLFF